MVFDVWIVYLLFCFKQKTAYEMRISDWSSDVCSSDLNGRHCDGRTPPIAASLPGQNIVALRIPAFCAVIQIGSPPHQRPLLTASRLDSLNPPSSARTSAVTGTSESVRVDLV